jgi:DNA-binding NarL/FixJ family response regulator
VNRRCKMEVLPPWRPEVLPPWRPEETPSPPALKPHQREVALLIGEGLTNQEIADRLGTTPGWVGTQIGRIVQRLGLTCRADIAAWASVDGLCRSVRRGRAV